MRTRTCFGRFGAEPKAISSKARRLPRSRTPFDRFTPASRYLSPRIAAKLVKGVVQPRGRTGLLSARERGVLRLVAAGLSNRQIGETLSISERTVKFHVTAIFNKLGAENGARPLRLPRSEASSRCPEAVILKVENWKKWKVEK